jgi:hypothetical protein
MAFIKMSLVDTTFYIEFGRNELATYKLALSPIEAKVGPFTVATIVREGLIKETSMHDENNFPLNICSIEAPRGDTATLQEIVDFYNDIVDGAKAKEYPTIVLALPALSAGSADNGNKGLLLIGTSEERQVFAAMSGQINVQDSLSCTKNIVIHGLDPMISSMVDHLHFAQQMLSAMNYLAIADNQSQQEAEVNRLMEELDGQFEN